MLMFLVSLRWWKDHDVSQLVNKLRFHIASTIDQNGRPPRKMEGCSSKCCKYHMQNPANTMQHERVCIILYIYIFQMSQMSCETRRSTFTMQVDVAECWKYENIENTTQTEGIHLATAMSLRMCHMSVPLYHHGFVIFELCCLFLCFFGLGGFASFLSSWLCEALYGFLDFTCSSVHCNQSHNRKKITNTAYTQTKTTT